MSKINRIRIMNLNYNGNTIRIDDETFDLNGESTLLSLRNGGGKTVLVQMVISLFVNKSYRDFTDRPFKSYFTTNRPTFLISEWLLDHGQGYFIAGMMVRKAQNIEENNNEELEMITFTGSYSTSCPYDIHNLPVIEQTETGRKLKGFGMCKKEFEELKKDRQSDFAFYDMSSSYQRRAYFTKLKEYQINHKEWESIIKKVNLKESGLSELFANARDEKGLVEKWLLEAVESKLNQESNRIREFQTLAYKLIRQYCENQSKIRRKKTIEKYFEDIETVKAQIEGYKETEKGLELQKSTMAAFIQDVNSMADQLAMDIEQARREILRLKDQLRDIEHEKLSYEIYLLEDERKEQLQKRIESEIKITQAEYLRTEAEKELCRFQCAGLFAEAEDFRRKISGLQAKIGVLMDRQKDTETERKRLGASLYHYYQRCARQYQEEVEEKKSLIAAAEAEKEKNRAESEKELSTARRLLETIGGLQAEILSYNKAEEKFNTRYQTDFTRNILGEYEEGLLALHEKKFQDELTAIHAEISRLSEKLMGLKAEEESLGLKGEQLKISSESCRHELEGLEQEYDSLSEEKERRKSIIKHLEMSEEYIDHKELILGRLDDKLEELESARGDCLEQQKLLMKEYDALHQGKTVELPENIAEYFEEQGIRYIYGMEWLRKNGRSVEENQKLTEKNPFLPYSIIMDGSSFEKLGSRTEEIYTGFPIPVIIREYLENALEASRGGVVSLGTVHFFVMFNRHLLNPSELERMLEEKKQQLEEWKKKAEVKRLEIQEYQKYRGTLEHQTFTTERLTENRNRAAQCRRRQQELADDYLSCSQNRKKNVKEQENTQRLLDKTKEKSQEAGRKQEEFCELSLLYQKYQSSRQEKMRLEKKEKESREKAAGLKQELERIYERRLQLLDEKKELEATLSSCRMNIALYQMYENEEWQEENSDYTAMEARYKAITEGISLSLEELNGELSEEQLRCEKKEKELEKKNKYEFAPEDYQNVLYSDSMLEQLEAQIQKALREENAAKEENKQVEKHMTRLDAKLEYSRKNMTERTGYEQTKERADISDTDFDARLKLTGYECEKRQEEEKGLADRLEAFRSTQDAMAEYMDFEITCETERYHLESFSREELNSCQGSLRRDLRKLQESREEKKRAAEAVLRKTAEKEDYQEDFFKKGFVHMLDLINQVYDMELQMETICASYDSILKKLQVDLENIEKERSNVEEIFLDYVKDIDDNMRQIDRNSSISVRGKSVRMLRINVPEWDSNRDLYGRRIQDYVDTFLKWGIEAVKKEQNVDELLGKVITTKKLYDDVVGIRNIDIRLYKIEAEREVPISWAQVSANSGGEGFVSAFIILACLLSYMRRDEKDLFAFGEEGKVLIMDNPFAQTNAEHLLKPLMDMAEKMNIQLICLSGLGGDSIYNRFDNIYVLNVVNSGLRQGMQYVKSEHIKGAEEREVVLSQFKTEQMSLFDIE
ncbi:MAG: hypothetical protein J6B06_01655 [Lachnospiraceae bacterium]|nr:hypothetical protein [Lachnospiraceae bacterium]